ncbi:MAG: hypothetical protein CVV07_01355 [Gammaproteobacteria bacterium HGW-Gammaproteobacteria-11]|nr:MAG: hypothetical protein CVV07_01355 [Gammaproteobacteria bacterium HGW-Gammaproteobacteria-11]
MRCAWLPLLLLASGMSGCAIPDPNPVPAELARVLFSSAPADQLSAYRLDGELVRRLRYADLTPGEHSLQVRYRFELPGGASLNGFGEPRFRTCILALTYTDFEAGKPYLLRAERRGMRPVAWLENTEGERLVRADVLRCGPGV